MFSFFNIAVTSGWLDLLKSQAGLVFIGGLLGNILTWSSRKLSSKRSVEQIYINKINRYMDQQDDKIDELNKTIEIMKENEVSKEQDNEHLRAKVIDWQDKYDKLSDEYSKLKKLYNSIRKP